MPKAEKSTETRPIYSHSPEVHNLRAPSAIVPDLIEYLKPRSVVDIGCGIGTFLHVFQKLGVDDIVGFDGTWVDKGKLYIDESCFREADLEGGLDIDRKFDLVLSLEVAEHLSGRSSNNFVKTLCSAGDVIVFSAALPGQGGENHINERSFDYWQAKFHAHGFTFYDFFRPRYWLNNEIDWWYRQNMFLVARDSAALHPEIMTTRVEGVVMSFYHPEIFDALRRREQYLEAKIDEIKSAKGFVKLGARYIKNKVSGRLR